MRTIEVTCLELIYIPGDYYLRSGHKWGTRNKQVGEYYRIVTRGGWAKYIKYSKLILKFEVDDRVFSTRVDKFFKDKLGKLTKNRIQKISQSLPITILLKESINEDLTIGYKVSEECMDNWLAVTGLERKKELVEDCE